MAQPLTILAVDDSLSRVVFIRTVLAMKFPEARFLGASSAAEAISLAIEARPDVTLIDDIMPFMSGYDVVEALRRERVPTRAIIMTVMPITPQLLVRSIRLGVYDYLVLPSRPDELIAKVQRALEAPDLTVTSNLTPLINHILLEWEYPEYKQVLMTRAALRKLWRN